MQRLAALVVVAAACGGGPQPIPAPVTASPVTAPRTDAGPSVRGPQCGFEPARPADAARARLTFAPKRRAAPASDDATAASCQIADSNIEVAIATVLALPPPAPGPRHVRWNRRSPPAHLDLVAQRFNLDADERRRLYRDGFVVPARLEQPSYGWAYHEIYQSQLPVYITVDSILNAVYAAHDGIVAGLERRELAPRLRALLASLHCKLPAVAGRYPDEVALDLDRYLAVARGLLGEPVASALGDEDVRIDAARFVERATAAGPMRAESLFGRARMIDWSQFQPRGHYTRDDLAPYFRAVMWLSRIEFNLVSRSSRSSHPGPAPDPSETPRETIVALALADLVDAAAQGDSLERFEQVFALLAGAREDVPLPALAALAQAAGVTDLRAPTAAAQVRAAIGSQYPRQARIHYMPEGSTVLPAIATFIGPRVVADTLAMRPLAHSEVPARHHLRGGDVAFVLGHDRGKAHLADDLARYPTLAPALDTARARLAAAPRGDDLYTAWLDAIRGLAITPRGTLPSFTRGDAFRDLRVSSAIAAFAQLRHNHVLIAGQAYGEGGCRIPDGFVEPAPAVYDALARYGELGAEKLDLLDGHADAERAYFLRLARIARVLATISRMELANQPLPATARGFLGMVSEMLPYGSDGRPTYTGWYFDLFHDRTDAIARPDLVADFFTSAHGVSYVGVEPPAMGIFVVDTGGGPRTFVGPVARAYEHRGPLSPRLDDRAARGLADAQRVAPWARSYAVARPPEPAFSARFEGEWGEGWQRTVLVVEAPAAIGPMTIELRDHHRVTVMKQTQRVGAGTTRFRFPKQRLRADGTSSARAVDFIVFGAGRFFAERELQCLDECAPMAFGAMRASEPTDAE